MNHFVYIIESLTSGRWYLGYSQDLERRLQGHNTGLNKSTAGRGPWKFIFVRPFHSKSEALSFERYLKRSRNKQFIKDKYSQYFGVYPDSVGAG
jgi:putative endonuclease